MSMFMNAVGLQFTFLELFLSDFGISVGSPLFKSLFIYFEKREQGRGRERGRERIPRGRESTAVLELINSHSEVMT